MSKKSEEPGFPLTLPDRKCVVCEAPVSEVSLERCVICHREFCSDCAHRLRGRRFCSQPCANTYMFGDEEDDLGEDAEE